MPTSVFGNIDIMSRFRGFLIEQNGDLAIDVQGGYYDLSGAQGRFVGATNVVVTDGQTNYVYLDNGANLFVVTTGYPTTEMHLRLGKVFAAGGTITAVNDERAFLTSSDPSLLSGSGNPNGVVLSQLGQTYRDLTNGAWYRCTSSPTGTVWTIV